MLLHLLGVCSQINSTVVLGLALASPIVHRPNCPQHSFRRGIGVVIIAALTSLVLPHGHWCIVYPHRFLQSLCSLRELFPIETTRLIGELVIRCPHPILRSFDSILPPESVREIKSRASNSRFSQLLGSRISVVGRIPAMGSRSVLARAF